VILCNPRHICARGPRELFHSLWDRSSTRSILSSSLPIKSTGNFLINYAAGTRIYVGKQLGSPFRCPATSSTTNNEGQARLLARPRFGSTLNRLAEGRRYQPGGHGHGRRSFIARGVVGSRHCINYMWRLGMMRIWTTTGRMIMIGWALFGGLNNVP
jgi:hypothetical protein